MKVGFELATNCMKAYTIYRNVPYTIASALGRRVFKSGSLAVSVS